MLTVDTLYYYQPTKIANENNINNSQRLNINTIGKSRTRIPTKVGFVICNSCLWCASCLNLDKLILECPLCDDDNNTVRCMSISCYDATYDKAIESLRLYNKEGVSGK